MPTKEEVQVVESILNTIEMSLEKTNDHLKKVRKATLSILQR